LLIAAFQFSLLFDTLADDAASPPIDADG